MVKNPSVNQTFTIPGRMEGCNVFYRLHRYAQANVKRESEQRTIAAIEKAHMHPVNQCKVHFYWYEPNHKRDLDNIAFSKKYILDGIVKAGILKDDKPKYVKGFTDHFGYDKENPRIEVEIEEIHE